MSRSGEMSCPSAYAGAADRSAALFVRAPRRSDPQPPTQPDSDTDNEETDR